MERQFSVKVNLAQTEKLGSWYMYWKATRSEKYYVRESRHSGDRCEKRVTHTRRSLSTHLGGQLRRDDHQGICGA